MTDRQTLLKAQQGELDAVLMYQMLADRYDSEQIKSTLKQLSAEEGKHASIFHKLTNEALKPNDRQGKLLVALSKIMPKKILFRLISIGEYRAAKIYTPVVSDYPEVKSVQADESRHADLMKSLAKNL